MARIFNLIFFPGGSGRDNTLLVTSIVQIILNPDCRTIRGLQALIEAEWLRAGHPFYTRTRHSAYCASSQSSHAPTFLLFLDCIYQIHLQFQLSFEYKTELLIELFRHAYYSNYGTFLGKIIFINDFFSKNSKLIFFKF